MRFFIDSKSGTDLEGEDGVKYKITNSYIELEYQLDDSFLVLYYIPRTNNSVFIATCWDREFDQLLGNLDENDLETIVETWPTLGQLMSNTVNDKYSAGVLTSFEDFDDGEPKWFVTSICGNLNLENIKELFGDRAQVTAQIVCERSMDLLVELSERKPDVLKAMGRGFVKGLAVGALATVAAFFGEDSIY